MAMQQMLHTPSNPHVQQSSVIIKGDPDDENIDYIPSAFEKKQLSIDSIIGDLDDTQNNSASNDDNKDKIHTKYKQLKEKYLRLHKNYKKTKTLRTNNDKLLNENRNYEQQLIELQQHVVQQKNTIIRQNKHLLRLRGERDDFADAVEEQKNEKKRLTEQFGKGPLIPLSNGISNFARQTSRSKETDYDDKNSHYRSVTSPLVNANTLRSETNGPLSGVVEDDENFAEDSQFTTTFGNDLDAVNENEDDDDDNDNDDEEEEKYVNETPGGPHDYTATNGKSSKNKPKFVEVDDITRDVERKYYSMSRSVLVSRVNPHRIVEEWEKIIGEVDDVTIVEQSSEICDAWNINECECVQRLLFILKYYSQWLNHKATYNKRKSRGTRDVLNRLPNVPEINKAAKREGYTESITEFISGGKLKYYNHVQLLNDFFHVKKFHIANPNQHEMVFKHFVNEFGFCDVKHCTSFRRNHREKSFFGHHNRFRRKIYHLDKKKFADLNEYDEHDHTQNEYELHEINTQQCLDMIHSTLIHDYHNTTTDNLTEFARQLLKSPQHANGDDTEYSYTGTNAMTPMASLRDYNSKHSNTNTNTANNNRPTANTLSEHNGTAFSYNAGNIKNLGNIASIASKSETTGISPPPPASPVPTSPMQLDPESLTQDVFSFGFGVRFSYWIRQWPDFVQPQYTDLRTELLENQIYRISAFEWDLLQHRAAIFMQTNQGIYDFLSQFKGSGNDLMKIKPGSRLTMHHLIALYTYTNYPNIRISFQKACLRQSADETFVSVLKRHEQIANWARLLYEAVYLFGHRMKAGEKFYHILRSKIMLSKFSANLSCPTTMISNRKIVNNSNIVIEVENAHSRGATYLDISYFSDVPNRDERLFFFGDLAFDNIILKGKSYRHYIKSLTLFQKIVQGSYFFHTSLKKKEYQKTIVHFMQNMIKSKDYGGVSNYVQMLKERKRYNDEDIIRDNDIPLYMQHLFDYFCSKLKTVWINQEEFTKLQPDVQRFLAKEKLTSLNGINELILTGQGKQSMMGKFTKFLHFEYSINFKYCCTLHWEISGNPLKQFWKGNKIFGQEFRVSTIRLFPYCVKDSCKDDGQFRFGIPIKSMPKYLRKIEFRVDLYIPECNYTFSAYSIIDERGTYWYSLFDSSQLRNFNKFTLKISFRLINLMVSNGTAINTRDGGRSSFPYLPKGNSMQPRGPSLSVFKLEDFRQKSGQNIQNVTKRISKKFQRNKNGGIHGL